MKPALLPIIAGEKAMSSTPVTTDTHIARTFSPSCSPPEVCAKVCHWRSFRWLISILQSAVSIAAAETHASNGSSHRRMKVRTIAPPAPVRSLVCRFRRTCSRRERLRSISDRNRLLSSASSAAHAARASPCADMKKPQRIAIKVSGATSERRSESNRRKRSISESSRANIQRAFCQSPRIQRFWRLKYARGLSGKASENSASLM